MHSISDLSTYCRKTTGDVPAKLVGASTTVVGSKMYLFGGRLVAERKMVADLYVFDLESLKWEKIVPFPEDDLPSARYFHSADAWNNQLVIFGGMGNKIDSLNSEDLRVLNDVRFFDISTRHWVPSNLTNPMLDPASEPLIPKARYAHLSSVTANRLFVIGGQDLSNIWLDDIFVYDLLGKVWVQRREYPRHCGTYRSVAVSSDTCVRLPQEELRASHSPSKLGAPGTRFRSDKSSAVSSDKKISKSLVHLPYSAEPSEEYPSDVYLYSNYNFTDVKRELEVFSPLPERDFTIHDRSSAMGGASFPPGLRFPSGAILGTHLIIAGTYLAHTYQSFSIWAFDLLSMTWSRIDPGTAVSSGSWFRGCLWEDANQFVIFGNRYGNLVDDYNRRLLSWDHVAIIDLEAFGIYKAPQLELDIPNQELGLAALEEGILTDFEIICDDGRKIGCSRKLLEDRWSWFKDQRVKFHEKAKTSLEILPKSSVQRPVTALLEMPSQGDEIDPRLTPRAFQLSEPYPITLAFVQYFYTLALITPLQYAPAVLSQLLVLSNTYHIKHLESLVKHAMHRALSNSTSVGVYEVATLCGCRSLQIRALKTVMSYTQKHPLGRLGRDTEDNGGNSSGGGTGNARRGVGSGRGGNVSIASPRGGRPRGQDSQNSHSGSNRGLVMSIETTREPAGLSTISETSSVHSSYSSSRGHSKRHLGKASIMSAASENEIRSVAKLLSPVVVDSPNYIAEEHEKNVQPIDDEDDSVIGSLRHLNVNNISGDESFMDIDDKFSSTSLSFKSTSPYSDSDFDGWSDDQPDRGQHTNGTTYAPSYKSIRRPRRNYVTDGSDTPSLTSSYSQSSLDSTNWSSRPLYSTPDNLLLLPVSVDGALASSCLADERHVDDDHDLDLASGAFVHSRRKENDLKSADPYERVLLDRPSPSVTVGSTSNLPPSDFSSTTNSSYRMTKPLPPINPTSDDPRTNIMHSASVNVSNGSTASSPVTSRLDAGRPVGFRPKASKGTKYNPLTQTKASEKSYWETQLPTSKESRKVEVKKRKQVVMRERVERFAAAGLGPPPAHRPTPRALTEKETEKPVAKKKTLQSRRPGLPMIFG